MLLVAAQRDKHRHRNTRQIARFVRCGGAMFGK
jgi:hypothetical protein